MQNHEYHVYYKINETNSEGTIRIKMNAPIGFSDIDEICKIIRNANNLSEEITPLVVSWVKFERTEVK